MEMLPEVNDEVVPKHHKVMQAIAVNRRLKLGLIVAVIIIVLGAIAIFSTYSSIVTKVEVKVRGEYEEQLADLQNQLKENEEKYENELNKQKESYEQKLANTEEKHDKEIAKKDDKIAEQETEIKRLIAENMVNFNEIETEIKTVGKLTTIDYCYTYAGTHADVDDFFGVELPWTKNSFTAQWDGVVALGVDMSKVTIVVDENSKVITVSIPKAEIFYHDVDEQSFVVVDERNNLLNPISVVDIKQFDALYEEKIYEKVAEQRMLEDAYENAKLMIENIINATPNVAGQYTINFKQIA